MHSFPVPVLGSLFVSFRPSSLRFPQLFHECFPSAFAFGLFRFPSGSFRPLLLRLRLLSLCFFLSVLPVFASQWLPRCCLSAFASLLSPFLPGWFPIRSLPVLRTRLSVCFLSSFPVSLPQPFHRCFPSFPLPLVRFSSGLFCSPSAFFRLLLLASDYSAFRSFFSLLPVLPCRRFLRCSTVSFVPVAFLFRPACFHAFLPIPVLSSLRFLSPLFCFVSQALHSFRPPVSSSAAPLCFRFRFRLLGLSVLNFSVRLRPRIYYHRNQQLSTPILYIFRLLSCNLLP